MIDIQNVTFAYQPRVDVLKDFSLSFDGGGIYGLLGKNGTGKSTLLYLIMGLLHPQKGTVRLDGVETRLRRPDTLNRLFIVSEEYNLPSIRLSDYLKAIRPFYPRFSDQLLRQCMEGFDMPQDVNLGHLSMGQKKKVYMCVALATNTQVLLMDEPTNGLDIPSKSQFRKVVAGSMGDDKTIVISTHQVRDVELLLDHLTIIEPGRVMLNSDVASLCQRLSFVTIDRNAVPANALYAEPCMQGYNIVKPNEGEETPINLELLFNALISNGAEVRKAMQTI